MAAAGVGAEAFAAGLFSGKTGIKPAGQVDVSACRCKLAGTVEAFDVAAYLLSQKTYLDRMSELSFAAMSLAFKSAGIDPANLDKASAGLLFGTAYGNIETARLFFADFLEKGPRFVKPVLFPHAYSNSTASLLAMEYGISGCHVNFASGAVSSSLAIVEACDTIRQGRADLLFAGGCDALGQSVFTGLDRKGVLTGAADAAALRGPFDKARSGFVPGEGAGILVLEEADHAAARGAKALAEIAGCTILNCPDDSVQAITATIGAAMKAAMMESGIKERDVDLVMAAANGSQDADAAELKAIAALTERLSYNVSVTSVKSLLGETLGAAGALQVAAVVAAMQSGRLPGVYGLAEPEFVKGVDFIGDPVNRSIGVAIVNTIDPGGSIVSLVVRT